MNKENQSFSSSIPLKTIDGLRVSALNPNYLHSNSTSHTWAFSAIAELVDNAYDPDVKASQLWIDIKVFVKKDRGPMDTMTFTDNGYGMNTDKIYKMLSFGFCEKKTVNRHIPVGHYGNGFKSGSMRLGKDALVFTKQKETRSLGFLSQTFLKEIEADTIIVPIVTWSMKTNELIEEDNKQPLDIILKYSIMESIEEINKEFNKITETGTRIIISNLREVEPNTKELEFLYDKHDIVIPDTPLSNESQFKREERQYHIPSSDHSLRSYLSILYLRPKMHIYLLGKKIKTVQVARSLSQTEVDFYKPLNRKAIKIVFGFSQNVNHYGIMMYHKNRLIKPYIRVGCQKKADPQGIGVIGIIQCNELTPTHNKQDFDRTPFFNSTMVSLGTKLNDYWNEKRGPRATENPYALKPDVSWVQCDHCQKWRKLPDYVNEKNLPENWYCYMHPDPKWSNCVTPEEEEDSEEIVRPYEKKRKRQEKAIKETIRVNNLIKEKSRTLATEKQLEAEKKRREMAETEKRLKDQEIERLRLQLRTRQTPITSTPVSFGFTPYSSIGNSLRASTSAPNTTLSQMLSQPVNSPIPNVTPSILSTPATPMPIIQNVVSLSNVVKNIKQEEPDVKTEPTSCEKKKKRTSSSGTRNDPISLDSDDEEENQPPPAKRQLISSNNDSLSPASTPMEVMTTENENNENESTLGILAPNGENANRVRSPSTESLASIDTTLLSDAEDETNISSQTSVVTADVVTNNISNLSDTVTQSPVNESINLMSTQLSSIAQTSTENFNSVFKDKLLAFLNSDKFEDVDQNIIDGIENKNMEDICLLLVRRSQALKNLKNKIFSVLQHQLNGSFCLPEYLESDIDCSTVDTVLDAVLENCKEAK